MVLLLDKLREAFCFCRQETEAVLVIIGDDHPGGYARGPCRGIRSLHDGSCLAPLIVDPALLIRRFKAIDCVAKALRSVRM
jgi:hypothetical protein